MITIVQNFICTQEERLDVIRREVPKMSEVFKDYEFSEKNHSVKKMHDVEWVVRIVESFDISYRVSRCTRDPL